VRRALLLAALVWAAALHAHDLITADSASRYLADAGKWRAAAMTGKAAQRAEAHYRLGLILEEIRELLNQDVAAHGKVQGLASSYLVEELARQGMALAAGRRGFDFVGAHFEQALKLAPRAAFAGDAGFRLLQQAFYASFEQDPLDWHAAGAPPLPDQIALAEELLARHASHPAREEIDFIAAILYTRAARDPRLAALYSARARKAVVEFATRYPGSLRAAAMPVLRAALPPTEPP
jgi:hypothetical protein